MSKPAEFAVVGIQNSGKTRLVQKMLRFYGESGLRCAVVKHHGHAVSEEVPRWQKPGSDTQLFAEAGANYTLLAGGGHTLLFGSAASPTEDVRWLLHRVKQQALIDDVTLDVIIAEGFKESQLAKVAVIRTAQHLDWLAEQSLSNLRALSVPQELIEQAKLQLIHSGDTHVVVFSDDHFEDLCRWMKEQN